MVICRLLSPGESIKAIVPTYIDMRTSPPMLSCTRSRSEARGHTRAILMLFYMVKRSFVSHSSSLRLSRRSRSALSHLGIVYIKCPLYLTWTTTRSSYPFYIAVDSPLLKSSSLTRHTSLSTWKCQTLPISILPALDSISKSCRASQVPRRTTPLLRPALPWTKYSSRHPMRKPNLDGQ